MEFILKYWIQFFFGLVISFATYLYHCLKKYYKQLEATKKMTLLLAKIEIINLYEQVKDKDDISIREKEKMMELYNEYSKFEQCDIIYDIMEEIGGKKIE